MSGLGWQLFVFIVDEVELLFFPSHHRSRVHLSSPEIFFSNWHFGRLDETNKNGQDLRGWRGKFCTKNWDHFEMVVAQSQQMFHLFIRFL